ncbi:MAG TPA: phage holin family protein [Methylophilaceae bacterium]|nr:phage holin family protein [Methylophilaceae bacterium]
MRLLVVWILNAISLGAVAYLMPSIQISGFGGALVATAVIALINVFIRPLLVVLTLPITVITLGLFILVINGLLFLLAGYLLDGFEVQSLWSGILGAILYSVISWGLTALLPSKKDPS